MAENKLMDLKKQLNTSISSVKFHPEKRTKDNVLIYSISEFDWDVLDKKVILGYGKSGIQSSQDDDQALLYHELDFDEERWFHFPESLR